MEAGTWSGWASAAASTVAVVVALALAARDDEARHERQAARRRLQTLAGERLRTFDLWTNGLEDPDGDRMTDAPTLDRECATFRAEVDALGRLRRRRGLRILTEIYGERSVFVAALLPDQTDDPAAVLARLFRRPALMLDFDPGPLRRRGALDVSGPDFTALRAAFVRLARV